MIFALLPHVCARHRHRSFRTRERPLPLGKVALAHEAAKQHIEKHVEDLKVLSARNRQQHITAQLRKVIFRMQQESIASAFFGAWPGLPGLL